MCRDTILKNLPLFHIPVLGTQNRFKKSGVFRTMEKTITNTRLPLTLTEIQNTMFLLEYRFKWKILFIMFDYVMLTSNSSSYSSSSSSSSSFPIDTTAHCGFWPVDQCPSIFSYPPPILSIFSLPALEDLFLLPLAIFSWVFPFSSLSVLE